MELHFADIKVVSVSGYSCQWKIMPEDITMVNDMPFVKLKGRSNGLNCLLREGNELAEATPLQRMLTSSIGYAKMVKMRDEAHKQEAKPPANTSCLFDSPCQQQQKNAKRSRIELQQQRTSQPRTSLTIYINVDGVSHAVDVMTPISSRDAIHVLCTTETLGIVLKFLRDEGFSTEQWGATGLPNGIYPRGQRFLAAKLVGAIKKHRIFDEVEAGAAWQSMDTDDADDEDTMPCDNEIIEEAA